MKYLYSPYNTSRLRFFLRIVLLFVLFFSLIKYGFTQKETYNWDFGDYARLDFNGKNVQAHKGSALSTIEGSSTISDSDGNLLFYSNGETVWNKDDTIMQNGTGLMGTYSTSQSALIIPDPANDSLYYLFTLGAQGGNFYYSVINIKHNNGLGEVITKNVWLLDSCTEKLAASRHSNGKDFWITIHTEKGENFYSYLVNASGIQAPVISHVGTVAYGKGTQGCMKFSHDQKRIVTVISVTVGIVELFDFNNSTGVVSNPLTIYRAGVATLYYPYGAEFSPDNKLLYLSWSDMVDLGDYKVYISQFDITSNNQTAIVNSKIDLVFSDAGNAISTGALQLGPDKRIYFPVYKSGSVGIIEYPNIHGVGCNAKLNGLYLEGGICRLGLPNLIPYLFECDSLSNSTKDTTLCYGEKITIGNYDESKNYYAWQDGATSSLYNVTKQGSYWVKIGKWGCYKTDTFNILYHPKLTVNLGNDTSLCYGQLLELNAYQDSAKYLWQNGSTSPSFFIETPGKYNVSVTKNNCKAKSDITIDYILCCNELLLPNLITTNEDGKNDELFIEKLPDGYTTIQVFNAWGERIYEDEKFNKYWKPENISDGVYYYILKDNHSKEFCKSWVQVLR